MISLSQLKMAQRNLIRMVGGQDAAGETIGAVTGHAVNQRRISEVLKDDIARSLRVHEVLILEAAAKQDQSGRQGGFPPVTRMLAATLGYALVKIPEATAGASDWLGGMGALARQAGQTVCLAATKDPKASASTAHSMHLAILFLACAPATWAPA